MATCKCCGAARLNLALGAWREFNVEEIDVMA
jgi:hypothetical protein